MTSSTGRARDCGCPADCITVLIAVLLDGVGVARTLVNTGEVRSQAVVYTRVTIAGTTSGTSPDTGGVAVGGDAAD